MINNITNSDVKRISKILLNWYDSNARFLPWREKLKKSPYHVWISEVMLQQTTVGAVIPRYNSFIKRWPNVKQLSLASIDEVLHEWQGLGYYSRAHNIHKTAKIVSNIYESKFPEDIKSLKSLPGIGDYTAGAVASIAFSVPTLPIDVNIERVLARVSGVFKRDKNFKNKIKKFASLFQEPKRPGDLTQAFMDFGSNLCKLNNPICDKCPLSIFCISFKEKIVHAVPGKKVSGIRKKKYGIAFFILNEKGQFLLRKRKNGKIFRGMMEIPMTPLSKEKYDLKCLSKFYPVECDWKDKNIYIKSPISGFEVYIHILLGKIAIQDYDSSEGVWVSLSKIRNYAIPSIFKKIISKVEKTDLSILN